MKKAQRNLSDTGRAAKADATRRVWADPEAKEARRKAIAEGLRARWAARHREMEVPGWAIRAGLREIYAAIAARDGEFAAARKCRAIKRRGGP